MAVTESMQDYILNRVRIDRATECWIWQRSLNAQGYARARRFNFQRAHRLALKAFRDIDIPAGMQVDHLCRVKSCVNPSHLDVVDLAENMRRRYDYLPEACINGHDAAEAYRNPQGKRRCRTCRREQTRRSRVLAGAR
jgi:hypothetical protein